MLVRIISGGEPGAEQAALDAAMEAGVEHGGWIPAGRPTEAGPLPDEFLLAELPSTDPEAASSRNVEAADGTVAFFLGRRTPHCDLSERLASTRHRPFLDVDLQRAEPAAIAQALSIWLRLHGISVLHVTGPRATEEFRAYARVRAVISLLLEPRRSDSPRPAVRSLLGDVLA